MFEPAQLSLFEYRAAQVIIDDEPTPAQAQACIALSADDFSPIIAEDIAPYYFIRYPDMCRRNKGHREASFFIIYRRSDDMSVYESATYDEIETADRAAGDVTQDFIEQGEK